LPSATLGTSERVRVGLSPHAPYSTSAALYERALAEARQRGWLLATHLAETLAEEEFLRTGEGELREAMERYHLFDPTWTPPGTSPVAYLDRLGVLAAPGLAIHCNYLDDADIALLRQGSLSAVYCPRSHTFFGHTEHPVERLLAVGVPVALGTDSLASNDRLDLLAEVREAARKHPGVPPETWLRLATLGGAQALGLAEEVGTLEAGKAADLCVVRGPAADGQSVAEALAGEEHEVVLTMVAGEVVFEEEGTWT
jgi:cytosine/adenosine deaminase-related metal-dependent hydrolase